jgi:drug/metabolite transporter (DMT)-like permease
VRRGDDVRALNAQQFLVMACVAIACNVARGKAPPLPSPPAWAAIAFLSTIATVGAFFAQFHAQRHVPPTTASLALSLEPAFAAAFAWTLGGEAFSWRKAIGGAVILAALATKSLVVRLREAPRRSS